MLVGDLYITSRPSFVKTTNTIPNSEGGVMSGYAYSARQNGVVVAEGSGTFA